MINPFNNEYYGIAAQDENIVLITTEATTILSKEEARLLGQALVVLSYDNAVSTHLMMKDAHRIVEEAERAVNSVGSYYSSDGTLMNADGTRSIFDDVDK